MPFLALVRAGAALAGEPQALPDDARPPPELAELEHRLAALEAGRTAPALFPLNPSLTAFGDLVGQLGIDPDGVLDGSTVFLRSLELDLRAAVDPFANAVAVIAFEQEPPPLDGSEPAEGFGGGPEEVYVDLVALPAGLGARVGQFKQPFGLANRTHPHDLPWVDVPPALGLLGDEGYVDAGGTLSWVLPLGAAALTTTAGALSGAPFEGARPDAALAGLGRVEAFAGFGTFDIGLGASAVHPFATAEPVFGADLSLRWRPSNRRSLVVPVEWIRGAEGDWGGYAALQVQTSRRLYLGFREDLMGTDLQHSGFASWYASEFLRIRGGGGYAPATRTATVLTQLTFVWGSHPVEPWWVNR